MLQRFVEQIIEDVIIVGTSGFNSASWRRTSTGTSVGAASDVLEASEGMSHIFFVLVQSPFCHLEIFNDPLYLAVTCPCAHAMVHGSFWVNFPRFLREGELGGPRAVR